MLQDGDHTLVATFLLRDENGVQLWMMEISMLHFFLTVEVEDDGVAYEIFNAPIFDSWQWVMHEIAQRWLKHEADTALEEEDED